MMPSTSLEKLIADVQHIQRENSRKQGQAAYSQRRAALKQLKALISDNETAWIEALQTDLGKGLVEAYASEIAFLLNEIDHTLAHLASWMKPEIKRRILLSGFEKTLVQSNPLGSVLIIAPWNYPLQLALAPVIGAVAAGNGVVLKPSESAPATSKLLAELVPNYLSAEWLYVVEGDSQVAQSLTQAKWDLIFFTGSPQTGQKVYQAAAKNLTPVVMELGGKNPCIVDEETALDSSTIQQILWGKFLNAGQTCVAPDTVYVPRKLYPAFLKQMKETLIQFYGPDPSASPDYGRIVHQDHLNKLTDYLKQGQIYHGGETLDEALYMAPTLLTDIQPDSAIAQEEIFGPILPIVPYDSIDEVIYHYQSLGVPLVVYIFSRDNQFIAKLENQLECGTLSINQVMLHVTSPNVPFGGKGQSGIGNYHAYAGFKSFTYQRTIYRKFSPFNLSLQYPPYSKATIKALKLLRRIIY